MKTGNVFLAESPSYITSFFKSAELPTFEKGHLFSCVDFAVMLGRFKSRFSFVNVVPRNAAVPPNAADDFRTPSLPKLQAGRRVEVCRPPG